MMKNDKKTLGLYIHIPFCVKKCNYCDFLSFYADADVQHAYVGLLLQEMKNWREKVSACEVDTIFIGGGTPSLLHPDEMERIFEGIQDSFSVSRQPEFSIECNPGTVTEDKLRRYRQGGVNRISFGLQSVIEEELKCLGRIHSYEDFLNSYRLARKVGFDNINVDLMSSIPGQTAASCETSVKRVISLEPEHISSYSLILEEGTPFYERYAGQPPVDEDTDRQMYEQTGQMLSAAGYDRYEISNYAKPGRACRHNLKYWRRLSYLGIGLGASSFLDHMRFSNEPDEREYRERVMTGKYMPDECERLSEADEKAEFMFLGLRCMQGVSAKDFSDCFGEEMMTYFGEPIRRCIGQGLLEREGDRVRLTKRGIDVSNRVFCEFLE